MIYQEYKNFLDKDFIYYLSNHYLINMSHRYGHASKPGETKGVFFYTEVHDDPVTNFVTFNLINKFNINQFKRVYINLQFNGMDGGWHKDDGDKTYMLMVTPTLKHNSGCFEIKENNKTHKIQFEQNKLVVFNAKALHRGMGPIEKNTPRITLAFKGIENEK
jgi:hypothetical protein